MGTEYSVLYDSVLSKIKDYDFLKLDESQVYTILFDYIRPAVVRFRSCKQDLSNRDDEAGVFNVSLTDPEIEILSNYMVVEYLDANYIRVPTAMKQVLNNKDFNAFSPANLLDKISGVRNHYIEETKQLMRDYSYVDSKIFDYKIGG